MLLRSNSNGAVYEEFLTKEKKKRTARNLIQQKRRTLAGILRSNETNRTAPQRGEERVLPKEWRTLLWGSENKRKSKAARLEEAARKREQFRNESLEAMLSEKMAANQARKDAADAKLLDEIIATQASASTVRVRLLARLCAFILCIVRALRTFVYGFRVALICCILTLLPVH